MNKQILKILLSPLAFIYGLILVWGGIIFPTTLVILFSLGHMIIYPFILLFNKTGADIKIEEPFIDYFESTFINYLAGTLILIWVPFWITYEYYKTGKLPI